MVSALSLLTLRSAALVARVLGTTGIKVVERVMGLILAAVAAQLIIDGVREAFPWTHREPPY
jgi:multiple antibiotic resistance protein